MVRSAPLIMTAEAIAQLHRLRDFAARHPVDMLPLMEALDDPEKKRLHLKQMTAQTMRIEGSWPFFVTFSIETNHPAGTCRHMSMSIRREGRVPSAEAVWMVAEHLGFAAGLHTCRIWLEELSDEFGGNAVNLVQPIAVTEAMHDG